MMRQITESDWKLFRQLQPVALDRFCQRVLSEVGGLASAAGRSSYERYVAVSQVMARRDKELANAFDNRAGRPRWVNWCGFSLTSC
jgi:hypothetical protein